MTGPVRPIRRWSERQPPQPAQPTKVDRWLQRLAHGAAPLALILALLGYVFTVRPVFQYQRLQEQSAKLELEKTKTEADLFALREKQASVALEIKGFEARLAGEQSRSARLASDAADARAHGEQARLRATEVEASLTQQLHKLDEVKASTQREMARLDTARWELVLLDLLFAYVVPELNTVIDSASSEDDADTGAFITKASNKWPRPYEELRNAVRTLREQNKRDIPLSYFDELNALVESHRDALQCDSVNFDSMRDEYRRERAAAEISVLEAKATVDRIEAEYKRKGQAVQMTDEYRTAQLRSGRVGKMFVLGYVFEQRLRKMRSACIEKGHAAIEEMKKEKGVSF